MFTSVVLRVAVEEIVLDGALKVTQFVTFIPVIVFHMHLPRQGNSFPCSMIL